MTKSLTWRDLLKAEKQKPYFINILNTIKHEYHSGKEIYPSKKDVFNAFRYTELKDVKVVILGQDPYHRPGQAHGLAFSVCPNVKIPPSLSNIYKELENTIIGFNRPNHGYLASWARQGVLLLNSVLTVRAHQPHSHFNLGWEVFTDKVIKVINEYCQEVVFFLWGTYAQKKSVFINRKNRHYVLKSAHPSPLSANHGFFGCNHFYLANKWLEKRNKKPINWEPVLPDIIKNS